ncbi:MAG: orotate phosphoribosyltransferase [Bacteroidetes bacterium]|nr:orotate phosphoribosyltransferase [Bacteroidota bacterium]
MSFVKIETTTGPKVASLLLDIGAIKLNYKNPFTWSSGWKSPVYCDNRLALSYPEIRNFVKDALAQIVKNNFPQVEYIAGVATAGIPQGALVADDLALPFVYVRPKPKDHGMGNLIEGKIDAGKKVVLIEDLISTGGSSLKAAVAMQEAGFQVVGMAAIFTYGFETAKENFEKSKIPLVCLSDFNFLLEEAVRKKFIDESELAHVKKWRIDPGNWK